MKLRNLLVLAILVFGISAFVAAEESKLAWEFSSDEWEGKRIAAAVFPGFSYDKVWDKVLDVLLFKKFTPWGALMKVTYDVVTVEKNSGLIVAKGFLAKKFKHTFKIKIRVMAGHVVMKCRCEGTRNKEVIEEFFRLLEKGL